MSERERLLPHELRYKEKKTLMEPPCDMANPVCEQPMKAYDVFTQMGFDSLSILSDFVMASQERIRRKGILQDAKAIRLINCAYSKTECAFGQPLRETKVDFLFRGTLSSMQHTTHGLQPLDGEEADVWFRMQCVFDLSPCNGACKRLRIGLEEDWPEQESDSRLGMNEYLLPIIYAQDYEKAAQMLLDEYFPWAENMPDFVLTGEKLACQMGLEVRDVRFADPDLIGQVYFDFAETRLVSEQGIEYTERIRPLTILVSKDHCTSPYIRNTTILHECCHVYFDKWFYFLQMMTQRTYAAFSNRMEKKWEQRNTPVTWMELQCSKLPAYLVLEKRKTEAVIQKTINEEGGKRTSLAIHKAINNLSSQFGVSPSMAKYRMIELGYPEAEGVLCYMDGERVPDHMCAGRWKKGITYTISAADVISLCDSNPAIAQLVNSGKYVYVEGHLCQASEKYLFLDRQGGIHLKEYARQRIDACCLPFRRAGYSVGVIFSRNCADRNKKKPVTDRYRTQYKLDAEQGTLEYDLENNILSDDSWLWGEYFYEMPDQFDQAVTEIMARKGVTQEALGLELGIDRRMVYKILHNDSPSMEQCVAICIALKLPYFVSEKIIEKAGLSFRRTDKHHLYREMLLHSHHLTVERCNDILTRKKMPPFFPNSESNIGVS